MNARSKIDRARKHLNELQKGIDAYFALKPYKLGVKIDTRTRRPTYYLSDVLSVPIEVALISGDVIQNLRSALDHLAYDLIINETKGGLSAKHIYFPIKKDLKEYEKNKKKETKGISPKNLELIDSIKPYKGGNDILWSLAALNNIDKHRVLITVGSTFGSVDIGSVMVGQMRKIMTQESIPDIPLFIKPADKLFPLKSGADLFTDNPDAEINPNMQFRFEIVLNEKGIIEGQPVTQTLMEMIKEVERILSLFK